MLVLPQWNSDAEGHVGLCRLLNRFGISALRLSLPYHDARMPPELTRADYIVSANVGRTAQVCRQAVLDARRAIAWLHAQGYESIGILGTSLGSCLSMLTTAHEPLIKAAALNHISPYFADVVWDGLSTMHVRETLEGNVTLDELRRMWLPISPLPFLDRVRGRDILLVYALLRSDLPGRSVAHAGDGVPSSAHRARAAGPAVRPLQHGRHAVQVDGRVRAVPVPEPSCKRRLQVLDDALERVVERAGEGLDDRRDVALRGGVDAVAVVTGSEMASHSAAAARMATNTPTTPTRLRLNRAEVIGERAQCTTGPVHLPL